MFRYLLAAFALLASPCAAQIVTSLVLIPDSPRDGKIKLIAFASRVTPTVARNTVVYGPCNNVAPYQYSVATPCPVPVLVPPVVTPPVAPPSVVVPPVVVPPPVVVTPPVAPLPTGAETVIRGSTVFFRSSQLVGAIGPSGTLASAEAVPTGWPTASDEDNKVPYIGLKSAGWRYDVIARGAPIDLDALAYTAGAVRSDLRAISFGASDFVGVNTGLTWTGRAGCFDLVKAKAVDGGTIHETVTLTNARCGTLTDVRYMRALDPDQDASQANVFTIVRGGAVQAAPAKTGPTVTLSSDDQRATAYGIPNLLLPRAYSTKLAVSPKVGTVTKGDGDAVLLFRFGTIATGQVVGFAYDLTVQAVRD